MPGSMNSYAGAGGAFIGEKNAAAAGMRDLRGDIWQRLFDLRQRGMNKSMGADKKDRRFQTISSMLSAAGPMAGMFQGGGAPPPGQDINQVPMDMMKPPAYMPQQMWPDRFRTSNA